MRALILLLCLAWGQVWAATSWYVCAKSQGEYGTEDGSSLANCYDGSEDISWAGITAGDTIYVKGDWVAADCHDAVQYCFLIGKSGGVGNPITIEFSGSTLNGGGARTKAISTSTYANLRINNLTATNFTTYGIDINSAGTSTDAINVYVEAPTISNITGCYPSQCNGIFGKGSGITVHNPRISAIADDGIWTDGTEAKIIFDTNDSTYYVRDVGTGAAITGDCFQFSGSAGNDTNLVQNGYCDHRSVSEKQCVVSNSIGVTTVTNTVCLAETNLVNGGSICMYIEGRADVRRNYCEGWSYGIQAASVAGATTGDSYIIGNVIRDFGWYGLTTGSATPSGVTVSVFNNTVDGTGSDLSNSRCLNLAGAAGSIVNATNNLSVNCKFGFVQAGGAGTKNLLTNSDFGNTTRYSGFASGSTLQDPKLIGGTSPTTAAGFRLTSGSPLRRVGTDLNIGNYQDVGNRAFLRPPSIGAWEATSGDARANKTARQ